MSDFRLNGEGFLGTYRFQCVSCGADLFKWSHALEGRHIDQLAAIKAAHICGGD